MTAYINGATAATSNKRVDAVDSTLYTGRFYSTAFVNQCNLMHSIKSLTAFADGTDIKRREFN